MEKSKVKRNKPDPMCACGHPKFEHAAEYGSGGDLCRHIDGSGKSRKICQCMAFKKVKIRQYALVKEKEEYFTVGANISANKDTAFVFLGEIPNMPGHCVVVEHLVKGLNPGKIYTGFHTDRFQELSKDEV